MTLLPRDKTLHFLVGLVGLYGSAVLMSLARFLFHGYWSPIDFLVGLVVGWFLVRALAYTKEAYDQARPEKHSAEILDAETTIAGASFGMAVAIVVVWMAA